MRRALNLVFAITEIAVPLIPPVFDIGTPVGQAGSLPVVPIQPAPYAFAIWTPIFALSLAYAIYGMLPSQRANPIMQRTGWWTAAAFAGNTVWMIIAQFISTGWPTVVAIIAIGIAALGALFACTRMRARLTTLERVIVDAPISMLAGWISAAMFVNVAAVARITSDAGSITLLALMSLLAGWVLWKTRGNVIYGATIAWAFIGIAIARM